MISEEEARKIMAPALRVLKGAMYLSRTFSGALLRLPEKYGGYGIKDLFSASVLVQAKLVLSNIRGSGNTAKKLEILIGYHQLELGLRVSIFDDEAAEFLGLLTNTWLVKVIRRVRKMKMRIKQIKE